MREDRLTAAVNVLHKESSAVEAARGCAVFPGNINFDHGDIVINGSLILLKMMDRPSVQFDGTNRRFSTGRQPAAGGITYFHAKA
jgi:hypothetical protein